MSETLQFKVNHEEYEMECEPLENKRYRPIRYKMLRTGRQVYPYIEIQQKAESAYQKLFAPKKKK